MRMEQSATGLGRWLEELAAGQVNGRRVHLREAGTSLPDGAGITGTFAGQPPVLLDGSLTMRASSVVIIGQDVFFVPPTTPEWRAWAERAAKRRAA